MIELHNDASQDIRSLLKENKAHALKLVAFINQLKADPSLQAHLLDHGFGADRNGTISISKWITMRKTANIPAWRMRAWSLEKQGLNYRIIYVYSWLDKNYYIMAVIKREDIDYDDPTHPIQLRIKNSVSRDLPGI
ncbi:hypothetical protein C2U68_17220 [Methylomonas koyamae]|nr:hypothetical protein C2U68_17220 [Methylomonas koyamae]